MTEEPSVYEQMKEEEEKRQKKGERKGQRGRPRKQKETRVAHESSEDEEVLQQQLRLDDSSEYSEENPEPDEVEPTSDFVTKELEVGDFILVELDVEEGRFKGQRMLHYVGVVEGFSETMIKLKYLRFSSSCGKTSTFHFPDWNDVCEVERKKLKGVLPKPNAGATPRLQRLLKFPLLDGYNLQ